MDISPSNLFLSRALSNPLVTIPHSTSSEGEIVRSSTKAYSGGQSYTVPTIPDDFPLFRRQAAAASPQVTGPQLLQLPSSVRLTSTA